MPRIMAIDYGGKRTGLAWTDPLQIIATGVGTVLTEDLEKKLDELANSVQSPAEVLNEFAEEDPESAPPQPQTETPQEDEIIYQPIQEKVLNDDGKPGELYQT